MKKPLAFCMILVLLLAGCATLGTVCNHGPEIKARIRSALQIAQVGYPIVAALAGQQVNPDILAKTVLIDAALDLLGQLAFDIACPTMVELNKAQSALETVQEAKAELGIK